MNRDLKDRVFDVPENILHKISQTVMHLNGNYAHGKDRAEKLLKDRKVKYGQLKKIIHDDKNIKIGIFTFVNYYFHLAS